MKIIEELTKDSTWNSYYQFKKGLLSEEALLELENFINNRSYRDVVDSIRSGQYKFSNARRIEIPKPSTGEKRVVYTYRRRDSTEHMILKVFAYLLKEYDGILCDNVYSYRNGGGVQRAISRLRNTKDLDKKFAYKVDIQKYFNSIDVGKMKKELDHHLDPNDSQFLYSILSNPYVEFNNEIIVDTERGVMPGLPFSTFLSNLYLNEMDVHFYGSGVEYYRFADDILIFADTKEELDNYLAYVHGFIKDRGLSINPKKEVFYNPGDTIEFLGLFLENGFVDINRKSLDRSMRRIRIEGRKYRKEVEHGKKSHEEAIHCFLTMMNHRHYGFEPGSKSCWSHWYFPLINTDRSLMIIDNQIKDWARFIRTGRHNRKNHYSVSYEELKEYGYRPLVHQFYNRNHKI